jgi:hypothetical protein
LVFVIIGTDLIFIFMIMLCYGNSHTLLEADAGEGVPLEGEVVDEVVDLEETKMEVVALSVKTKVILQIRDGEERESHPHPRRIGCRLATLARTTETATITTPDGTHGEAIRPETQATALTEQTSLRAIMHGAYHGPKTQEQTPRRTRRTRMQVVVGVVGGCPTSLAQVPVKARLDGVPPRAPTMQP